ncbi:MAG: thioredoxin [Crenarchaeota archaeon]|nr:MAG: thioredoxin [Thermoproteota archaeon]
MNKNSLLTVILILCIGIGIAYWMKNNQKDGAVDAPKNEWNDWSQDKKSNDSNNWEKYNEIQNNPEPEVNSGPPAPPPGVSAASYKDALNLSKNHKKPVLLFFTANWCGYCRQMKADTLSNTQVKNNMKDFIFYEVNTDREQSLARQYGVRGLPTYKVINSEEKVLAEGSGFKEPRDFIAWLQGVLNRINPFKKS